ncbi:MAG: hypothetical protein NTZ74_09425 [Chloroflexi bacterium]|nr:hypothetical protein [Chloroflexota bacterium]
MAAVLELDLLTPPSSYEDWLYYFDFLKSCTSLDNEVAMTIVRGSFVNKGYIAVQFNQILAETINEMLNKRIARFLKDLNMHISLNELSDIVPLFVKFRNEIKKCMFFIELDFLDDKLKRDLEKSMRTQMEQFWNDTVTFLQKQTLEYSNSDLEDSLFQIRRLQLF